MDDENNMGMPLNDIPQATELFKEESLVAKARLLESEYKNALIEMICNETFTSQTKNALINVIYASFDKNVVLSKTLDLESRKMDFEITLNIARLSYKKVDTMNNALPNFENTIRISFNDFVSRSANGWERGLQNKSEYSSEQKISQTVGPGSKPPEKKKGFNFNFLGGS